MFEIIPSPGTEDKEWSEVEKKLLSVKPFAKTIHVDIADGKFTPNTTFADPAPFAKYANDFLLEVHLMVEEPIDHLKKWADAGFRRFIGHVEKMSDQAEFVAAAQLLGEVGLAVDGPTGFDAVTIPLDDLDCLLFYTADRAGFSGKSMMPERLEKVKEARQKMPYLPIEIDGGINDKTIEMAYLAGVTRFVSTGFLFNNESPEQQFKLLHERLKMLEERR